MNNPFAKLSITNWITIVLLGLLLETCILGTLAGIFLLQRGSLNSFSGAIPGETLAAIISTVATPAIDSSGNVAGPNSDEKPAENLPTPTDSLQEEPTPWASPPGGQIVFVCFDGKFDQICLMNADGANRRQLTDIAATNFYPSLSPAGDQVVFSSNRDGNFEIYQLDLASGETAQLTENIGNCYAPQIAPNGNRVVFTQESAGLQNIWVMRGDGGNARPLTDAGSDIDPTWSPNGEQIAFTSARNGPKQIFLMNANGNNPRAVEIEDSPKIGGRVSWSPDGNWLAFYGGVSGSHEIYLTSVDGRLLYTLTDGGDNLGPSFSPDGEWLAFTSFRDGNNEIYIMRTDGAEQTRLTRTKDSDWQPRWGALP